MVHGFKPCIGALCRQLRAWNLLQTRCLPLSLCPSPARAHSSSLSLFLSKINKYFLKRKEIPNPKEIAKRVGEILILQVNPQWPNMTSLGRGREKSQKEEPRLTPADIFPTPFTQHTSPGHRTVVQARKPKCEIELTGKPRFKSHTPVSPAGGAGVLPPTYHTSQDRV